MEGTAKPRRFSRRTCRLMAGTTTTYTGTLGAFWALLGNLEGSFSYYVKSVRLNKPKDGSNEGMFKRYREITGIRRRIKALSPSNPISFYVAGEILLDVNWDETAMDMIGTGIRFRPEPVIHQILGDLYTKRTRCAEAIDEYKLALELRGGVSAENLPALYNNLIACLFACGRFNEVLEYGKKAISLNVTESHMMEMYSAVLGMGPEPVDNDQVACGWTHQANLGPVPAHAPACLRIRPPPQYI